MSQFAVPVVLYAAEGHPNADRLELAIVGGWRAACRIGDFFPGQKVAYIPTRAVLPWDLVVELGLADPPRLAGPGFNRVTTVRLRGVISQGIVYGGDRIAGLTVGDDAADTLGLTKWVPEVPPHMQGVMVPGPKLGYEIDDIQSWPGRLITGEPVVVTEKLHGTFCCLGLRRGGNGAEPEIIVSSKGKLGQGLRFDLDEEKNWENLYVRMWRRHGEAILELFEELSQGRPCEMYFFGEICGRKVGLSYELPEPRFFLFDVLWEGEYAPWGETTRIAKRAGLTIVPELMVGPWREDMLNGHTSGQSVLASHHREGVVVKPLHGRHDWGLTHPTGRGPGRVIFRHLNEQHLLRKGGVEYQ